jgi:SAM-dependent methyltransferase
VSAIQLAIDGRLIPPPDILPAYARRADFAKTGAAFVRAAAEWGLEPDHRVLDLGCGVGRFAVAYAAFADDRASYDGLDVSAEAIEICNRYISSNLPRFNFHLVDVFNAKYRSEADSRAASYEFPFPDRSFDFVFSNSLFTHLTRADVENYVHEIGRVLMPGGRCLNTFFLLNEVSKARLEGGRAGHQFPHAVERGVARAKRLDKLEAMIAYEEGFIRDLHREAGMTIAEPVRYGSWSLPREEQALSGPGFGIKDIVVAVRA